MSISFVYLGRAWNAQKGKHSQFAKDLRKKMPRFNPKKLHVAFKNGTKPNSPLIPRCYTLTHSDFTGELFLTIAADYDREALSNWQTRLMHDEVVGEWCDDGPTLQLICHVSGNGLNFGTAGWRYGIFKYHMPMVLQTLRYGDRLLYEAHPNLDTAPILIHFKSHRKQYNRVEHWGVPGDHRV